EEHDLSGVPHLTRLALKVAARIKWGTMLVETPDGRVFRFEGQERPEEVGVIIIKDYRFAPRLMFGGGVGFFQAFADDQWDSPDVAQFLRVVAANADRMQEYFRGNTLIRRINYLVHLMRRNTKIGARRNIMAHYDLGNSFYETWLDRSMTYSSAKFEHPDQDLQAAQTNKYRELARRINLQADESVLEIGSGWGGFAEFAAGEVGARVTGITISPEQYDYARERMFKAGLNDKVEIRLQDYRDVEDKFDKVASIEMFEAVGKEYWPTYFNKVRNSLKPGGLAGLQIITIDDRYFDRYQRSADFIQRFIFPGGMLPSPQVLREHIAGAGLAWRENVNFGVDYADTLKSWQERFVSAWDDIRTLGFDERFNKLWRYYLSYCEAGFRAGTIDVTQVTVARP
ncbi:MAG: cyclopropane-fatty-acyl-phospholipid synthase family protein, partial [Pseudomonadota bacterium]